MTEKLRHKTEGPDLRSDMAKHAQRAAERLIAAQNQTYGRPDRLRRLSAPENIQFADQRIAVKWLQRALRIERGLAVRGAAQYSFTRHVALLRALAVELDARTPAKPSVRRVTGPGKR
jgi:hypothetical protein